MKCCEDCKWYLQVAYMQALILLFNMKLLFEHNEGSRIGIVRTRIIQHLTSARFHSLWHPARTMPL